MDGVKRTNDKSKYVIMENLKLEKIASSWVRFLNFHCWPHAWYINFGGVCLSVCPSVRNTMTFESLDVGSSFVLLRYISTEYGSSSYMKVIGLRSRSQEQKSRKSIFPQCKTSIGNNCGSIKHTTIRSFRAAWSFCYGGSNGVSAVFVTWPEVSTRNNVHAFAGGRP